MTPNGYDNFVQRMATKRGERMPLDVATMGLASEAGEVAGLVKKQWERDALLDRAKMLHELGDVIFYLSAVASHFGFSLEDVMNANVDKLEARFPERK